MPEAVCNSKIRKPCGRREHVDPFRGKQCHTQRDLAANRGHPAVGLPVRRVDQGRSRPFSGAAGIRPGIHAGCLAAHRPSVPLPTIGSPVHGAFVRTASAVSPLCPSLGLKQSRPEQAQRSSGTRPHTPFARQMPEHRCACSGLHVCNNPQFAFCSSQLSICNPPPHPAASSTVAISST